MIINNINFIWYIIWSLKSTFKNNYHFRGMCRLTSTVTVDLIEHDDVNGPAHILVRKRVSGTCVCVYIYIYVHASINVCVTGSYNYCFLPYM